MERSGIVEWYGTFKKGHGEISLESGVLKNSPYSFHTRFENQPGTNPEELIAAAHASCFLMALSGALERSNVVADFLQATANVSVNKTSDGFAIESSKLTLRARTNQIDEAGFRKIAQNAKDNCPVSKALNLDISLDIKFEGERLAEPGM